MPQPPHLLDYIRQVLAVNFADKPMRRVQASGSYTQGEAPTESDLLVEKAAPAGWACYSPADELLTDVLFRPAVERQFEILGKVSSPISNATQNPRPFLLPNLVESFTGLDRQFSPYGRV